MQQHLTKNKIIWLSVVVGLVLLNIWRWWPSEEPNADHRSSRAELVIGELSVAIPEDSIQYEKGIIRDLFQVQLPEKKVTIKQEKTVAKPKITLPSAEQLARQDAEAGLSSIKLIATAKRRGKLEAYLSKGDLASVVTEGMTFARDYTVLKITVNSIEVAHNNTGIQREITLSK